jgi:hypothetical protein
MRLLMLTSPYTNAGDFLIFKRAQRLLESQGKEVCIETVHETRKDQFDLSVKDINGYSGVVTGGGGAQFVEEYILKTFVYSNLDEIKVPIHYMGTGLYGRTGDESHVYQIKYSEAVRDYFRKILQRGGSVCARDFTVASILKHNDINGYDITGCPAWFDLRNVGTCNVKKTVLEDVQRIVVSNQGITKKSSEQEEKALQTIELLKYLKNKFNNPEITVTFNNGIDTKYSSKHNRMVQEFALSSNMECLDISGSADGFAVIDEADIHIGYRLHSHIYSLSVRVPSILIEEDLRGYGFNDTLGLPHLTAFDHMNMLKKREYRGNPYLLYRLDDIIDGHYRLNWKKVEHAVKIMDFIYEEGMANWLRKVTAAKALQA